MKLSFLFRTDVHVAERGPESWKGDYAAEIWSNLEQVGELARKHSVRAVLDGGDYFHLKAPSRNAHSLVVRSAEVQAGYPCDTFCIEGNHDMTYNSLASIERQPLGVLYATGVFQHLRDEVFEEGDLRVRVVGVPYDPTQKLETLRGIRKQPGDSALLAVVHALAAEDPPGHVDDFFGEPVFRYRDLVFDGGPDVWMFGHWHRDQGIVEIEGRRFVNQGALSRGALVKENLSRIPKVALIEVSEDGIRASTIPMKVLPAGEVFDLDAKERRDQEAQTIDEFVLRIQEDVQVSNDEDLRSTVNDLDFAPEVRAVALEYLERARS